MNILLYVIYIIDSKTILLQPLLIILISYYLHSFIFVNQLKQKKSLITY